MPRVTAAMLATLVERWRETGAPLVLSEYGTTVAPPVLYARALFGELAPAAGENPGKAVVARHRARAAVIRWPTVALADLDTPAELAAFEDGGASRPPGPMETKR
jgi:molybdenum cofactor cytidylyltransferase